jgi:NADH:ubiquinone oxidoreductase subunit 3 (subunit A)
MTRFNQYGSGVFYNTFKGTFGVLFGIFTYIIIVLGFMAGVLLILNAKKNICPNDNKQNANNKTINNCSKSISDTNSGIKAKYYGGIIMTIIFGLLLLIIILPNIITQYWWRINLYYMY